MENRCMICGNPIGDNNPDGLGAECRKALQNAKYKAAFQVDGFSLEYNHLIAARKTREVFLKVFKNTKFRSPFHKSFYESMQNTERISKKQLNIMTDRLFGKDISALESLNLAIIAAKKDLLHKTLIGVNITREQIEIERALIRKGK